MRVLLINQTFHPDVVSSGQHLSGLARRLAEGGNEVTVITSRRGYDDPTKLFPRKENWHGVNVCRIFNTGFSKGAKWKRAMNFATFLCCCFCRMLLLPKQDVVLAMTSPPLVSALAAAFSWLRGARFCYWVMDLNPDEAIAAGWLSTTSLPARLLEQLSRFSLRQASAIVVLDRFMQERILAKGIEAEKIKVLPPWSHDAEIQFNPEGRLQFRRQHGLDGKFVVMYSGNHSPCHPLDTILGAARRLRESNEIAFCFIGGGAEFRRVKRFANEESLSNILCLPYQPLDCLSASLSAGDLHLVVMGNPFVGVVHPCKAYNILRIGLPILYIGPKPSHISEALQNLNGEYVWRHVAHGEVTQTVKQIAELRKKIQSGVKVPFSTASNEFSEEVLVPRLVRLLDSIAKPSPVFPRPERGHSCSQQLPQPSAKHVTN